MTTHYTPQTQDPRASEHPTAPIPQYVPPYTLPPPGDHIPSFPPRRRRWLWAVGAIVALGAVGVSTGVLSHDTSDTAGVQGSASSAVPTLPSAPLVPGYENGVQRTRMVDGLPVGVGDPIPVKDFLGAVTPGEQIVSEDGRVCTAGPITEYTVNGNQYVLTATQCTGSVGSKMFVSHDGKLEPWGSVASAGNAGGITDVEIITKNFNPMVSTPNGASNFDHRAADPNKEAIGEVAGIAVPGKTIIAKLVSKENGKLIYRVADAEHPGALGGAASGAPVIWAENGLSKSFKAVLVGLVTDGTDAEHVVVSPVAETLQDNDLVLQ